MGRQSSVLNHVVLFRWLPATTDRQKNELHSAALALGLTARGPISLASGPTEPGSDSGWDYCLVARFQDRVSFEEFLHDAHHLDFVESWPSHLAEQVDVIHYWSTDA